jgi:hypothetical protein
MRPFEMYFGDDVLTNKGQRMFGRQIDHKLDPGRSADHRREFTKDALKGLQALIASFAAKTR